MSTQVKVKTEMGEDIRMHSIDMSGRVEDAFQSLKALVATSYKIKDGSFHLKANDEENDKITVCDERDFVEVLENAKKSGTVAKFYVSPIRNEAIEEVSGEQKDSNEELATVKSEKETEEEEEESNAALGKKLISDIANNGEFRTEMTSFLTTFVVALKENVGSGAEAAFTQALSVHEQVYRHPAMARLAPMFPTLIARLEPFLLLLAGLNPELIPAYLEGFAAKVQTCGVEHMIPPCFQGMFGGSSTTDGGINFAPFGMCRNLFGGMFPPPPPCPPFPCRESECGEMPPAQSTIGEETVGETHGPGPWGSGYGPGPHGHGPPGPWRHRRGHGSWGHMPYDPFHPWKRSRHCGGARGRGGRHQKPECLRGNKNSGLSAEIVNSNIDLADGAIVAAGQVLIKSWRVKNTGIETWDGVTVQYRGRLFNEMVDGSSYPVETTAAGSEVTISVSIKAPLQDGKYSSSWRLVTKDGLNFGPRLTCAINVIGESNNLLPQTSDEAVIVSSGDDSIVMVDNGAALAQLDQPNLSESKKKKNERKLAAKREKIESKLAQLQEKLSKLDECNSDSSAMEVDVGMNGGVKPPVPENVPSNAVVEEVHEENSNIVDAEMASEVYPHQSALESLISMGFTDEEMVKNVLNACEGDVDEALEVLEMNEEC